MLWPSGTSRGIVGGNFLDGLEKRIEACLTPGEVPLSKESAAWYPPSQAALSCMGKSLSPKASRARGRSGPRRSRAVRDDDANAAAAVNSIARGICSGNDCP